MGINDYMANLKREVQFYENAIISVLNSRPRYLRWIPKKFYVRHFLEIHKQDTIPRVEKTANGYSISKELKIRIYDKIRRRFINF